MRRANGMVETEPGGVRIGIDLVESASVSPEHMRYFLTPAEREQLSRRDPAELWALKEAAWKALGCSPEDPFTALELDFDHSGAVEGVSFRGRRRAARAAVTSPHEGYRLVLFWIEGVGEWVA